MKMTLNVFFATVLLSSTSSSFAFLDNNGWGNNFNPRDEWNPRYWAEEMPGGNNWNGPWNANNWNGNNWGGPWNNGYNGPGYGAPGQGQGYGGPGQGPGYGGSGPGYGGPGFSAPGYGYGAPYGGTPYRGW